MLLKLLIATALASSASLFTARQVRDTGEVGALHSTADSAAAAAVVTSFHNALANSDSAVVLALLSLDATILESGEVETRNEYRSHHLAADIAFTKALPGTSGPLQVYVNGSTAWTIRTTLTQGDYKGRSINSAGVESMVLTRSGGTWQIRSIHWSSHARR